MWTCLLLRATRVRMYMSNEIRFYMMSGIFRVYISVSLDCFLEFEIITFYLAGTYLNWIVLRLWFGIWNNYMQIKYGIFKYILQISITVIQQLRGQNFAIFWQHLSCVDSFYTLRVDKNRHFLPPLTHPVVIERPLIKNMLLCTYYTSRLSNW